MSPADAPLPSKDADAIWPVIDRRKTELKYVISNIVDEYYIFFSVHAITIFWKDEWIF